MLTLKEERRGKCRFPPLSTELCQKGERQRRKEEEKLLCRDPTAAFSGASIWEGGEWPDGVGGPSFAIYCQRANPGNVYVNRAQTSYTLNNKKYTFQGEVGQEKPDFVCSAEYFL